MIKKVYIIGWCGHSKINPEVYKKIEDSYYAGEIKNNTYFFDITKNLINTFGNENVVNCWVLGEGEYKNKLWLKGYYNHYLKLFIELYKNRKESLFIFHGLFPRVVIYSLIPAYHKAWWRHGIIGEYSNSSKKIKWILMYIIQSFFQRFMNTIFYVNENEKNELDKFNFKGNSFFLPIPIHTDFWKKIQRSDQINQDEINITCVGSIGKNKNQLVIIKAIKNIKNCKLNIVGGSIDNIYYKMLLNYVKDNNINNVVFHGHVEHEKIKEVLKYTDIYIQPSFQEGQCQTIIEAGLTGVPLILSDIPTFKDSFGKFALYFSPNNEQELKKQILTMVEKYSTYNKNNALIEHLEKWSIENFNSQLNIFTNEYI